MSKMAIKGIIAAVLAVANVAGFTAQETATLQVTARIAGGCVLSTSGPMAFGDLSLTSGANEVKQVTVTYRCAAGQTVSSFTVAGENDGLYSAAMVNQNTGAAASTDTIPYTITWTNPAPYTSTAGFAAGQNVILTGTIVNADYMSKAPGNYAHSVLLAINY
jgi:spore coat protein U-like protein